MPDPADLDRRIEAIERQLQHLETKWDGKLDKLSDRIGALLLAALATLASVTLALLLLLLTHALNT